MDTDNFYTQLPVYDNFSAVSDLSNYSEIPEDWYVVAADVKDSTGAIKSGLYKAVNIVGVSVITSVRNAARPEQIPYIFGGDGASLCIPPSLLAKTRQALMATRKMAESQFGLTLRVGAVPLNILKEAGHSVLIARYHLTEFNIQTAFAGGGIEYAENLIKDDKAGKEFRFDKKEKVIEADYSGLECRWDHVYSEHGETISLIVKALSSSMQEQAKFYNDTINMITSIYGDDEDCRPVQSGALHLTNDNTKLDHELKVRTFSQGKVEQIKYWLFIRIQNLLGLFFMTLGLRVGDVSWGEYKDEVVNNTDFRKFDGVLRQVISGTAEQRENLIAFLKQCYEKGECVYGIHVSDSALVTCMINSRSGEHSHFVDGSNGGYAMAAVQMKQQLKTIRKN